MVARRASPRRLDAHLRTAYGDVDRFLAASPLNAKSLNRANLVTVLGIIVDPLEAADLRLAASRAAIGNDGTVDAEFEFGKLLAVTGDRTADARLRVNCALILLARGNEYKSTVVDDLGSIPDGADPWAIALAQVIVIRETATEAGIVSALLALLADPNDLVRAAAMYLMQKEKKDAVVLEAAYLQLGSANVRVRVAAARLAALASVAVAAQLGRRLREALLPLADSDDPHSRSQAALLRQLFARGEASLAPLDKLESDPVDWVAELARLRAGSQALMLFPSD